MKSNELTEFHLETDRKNEIHNKDIERRFCTFTHHQQDDCLEKQVMAVF